METEHLRIYPAMQEQMEAFIAAEADVELKKAYIRRCWKAVCGIPISGNGTPCG